MLIAGAARCGNGARRSSRLQLPLPPPLSMSDTVTKGPKNRRAAEVEKWRRIWRFHQRRCSSMVYRYQFS